MNTLPMKKTLVLAIGVALYGCGGGGGSDSVGSLPTESGSNAITSNSTSVSSTGTIDGFGSIFVNGVEFETDEAVVSLDGEQANQQGLRLGMVVTVNGTVNEDGKTGKANVVVFDDEVQGPVAAIEVGLDGDTKLLNILGVEVIVERTSTVFDDTTFDTLAVDDLIEASGFMEPEGPLRATRIEKKSDFVPGASEIELKGTVSSLTATEFNLDGYVVDFSNADLSEIPGGVLSEGMFVEVKGTLEDDRITASKVEQEDDIEDDFDSDDEVSIQGTITNFVSAAQFEVSGVAVDASDAKLKPAQLLLADGVVVEVEGIWDGDVLVAKEVESRRGRVKIEASVATVGEDSVTLQFVGGTVTVQVDSQTLLDDETDQKDPLTLDDIVSGDFLELEAINIDGVLMATRIDRDELDDDILQAPVESFNPGLDITLLGVTFSTVGAEFEGRRDRDLSATEFYDLLQVGDLVKVEDKDTADGIADEVEFEEADELDGEEFDDEDTDDDCESDDEEESDEECELEDDCDADEVDADEEECESDDEDGEDDEDDADADEDEDEDEDQDEDEDEEEDDLEEDGVEEGDETL
jgi:hypothetical protein